MFAASFGSALFANWAARHNDEVEALRLGPAFFLGFGHSVEDTVAASDTCGWLHGIAGSPVSLIMISKWIRMLEEGNGGLDTLRGLECPGFDAEALLRARTFREWDAACAPAYGFPSLKALYEAADVHAVSLWKYSVPTLFINAEDDPICPAGRLQGNEYSQPHLALVSTKYGGHLGWIDGFRSAGRPAAQCSWLRAVAGEFVHSALAYTRATS